MSSLSFYYLLKPNHNHHTHTKMKCSCCGTPGGRINACDNAFRTHKITPLCTHHLCGSDLKSNAPCVLKYSTATTTVNTPPKATKSPDVIEKKDVIVNDIKGKGKAKIPSKDDANAASASSSTSTSDTKRVLGLQDALVPLTKEMEFSRQELEQAILASKLVNQVYNDGCTELDSPGMIYVFTSKIARNQMCSRRHSTASKDGLGPTLHKPRYKIGTTAGTHSVGNHTIDGDHNGTFNRLVEQEKRWGTKENPIEVVCTIITARHKFAEKFIFAALETAWSTQLHNVCDKKELEAINAAKDNSKAITGTGREWFACLDNNMSRRAFLRNIIETITICTRVITNQKNITTRKSGKTGENSIAAVFEETDDTDEKKSAGRTLRPRLSAKAIP